MKVLYRTAFEVHCDKNREDLIEPGGDLCRAWMFYPKRKTTLSEALQRTASEKHRVMTRPQNLFEITRPITRIN